MNRSKSIILGLILLYCIWVIIALLSSNNVDAFQKDQPGWMPVLILFPIVVIVVGYFWYWAFKLYLKERRHQDIKMEKPSLNNKLSNSPLEWIHLAALFFIIVSSTFIIGILIQSHKIHHLSLLGIAYGLGFFLTIRLSLKNKTSGNF